MTATPRPFKGSAPYEEPMTNEQRAEETPQTPGYNYSYMDKTKPVPERREMQTEANHAILNPAFYGKAQKPEALWGEAEKAGAEFPLRIVSVEDEQAAAQAESQPSASGEDGVVAVVPLGPGESEESTTEEAAEARKKAVEELAQKDIENDQPVATGEGDDPQKEADAAAEEQKQEESAPSGKVRRRRTS